MAIRINRVTTRGGDKGETSLASGQRVPKDSARIECAGAVDELNAVLGLARTANRETPGAPGAERDRLDALLTRIQNELFVLGADLSTLVADRHPKQAVLAERHVAALEREVAAANEGLPELTSFVLPGGGWVPAFLHQARTVCRRAERRVAALGRSEAVSPLALVYLNRLSDLLFVLGRRAARARGEAEPVWEPEKG